MLPRYSETLRERRQVVHGPEIVRRGPARADEVAQKMDMEGENAEARRPPSMDASRKERDKAKTGTEKAMKEGVVIGAVQEGLRTTQYAVAEVDDQSEAVEVGRDARPCDQVPVSRLPAAEVANLPADEKMRDGIHGVAGLTLAFSGDRRESAATLG
jgi:hypothetical protein